MESGREEAISAMRLFDGEHLSFGRFYPGPVERRFEIDASFGSDEPRAHAPASS